MQIQPLTPIASYYTNNNNTNTNKPDNTKPTQDIEAYNVAISVDKSLRNHYSNLLSKYSNGEGNSIEQMKNGYSELLDEINQKHSGNHVELESNIRALDTAFRSAVSMRATMRSVVMNYNDSSDTESQGLQLQQKISKQPDYDKDEFENNTASTLGKFADKFIELSKSGSVDNAWSNAISFFSKMETSSVNKLSLNDIFSLFTNTFEDSPLSPLLHGIASKNQ